MVAHKSLDSPVSPSGEYCRIFVRDNGIGFSNVFRERIFDIFLRLNDPATHEGTGIGLSIVKKAIEHHGGLITASAAENEGATFTLVLPIKHERAPR
jgi:signal transduction histidine kinase